MIKEKFSSNYDDFYQWVTEGYQTKIKIDRKKDRITVTNEIFTKLDFVLYGLALTYPAEIFKDPSISFSDNCVGEGVWLVGMALKRMEAGLSHEDAIKNLKGIDIMQDNVDACRERLLFGREDLRHIVEKNIQCHNALIYGYKFAPMGPARRKTEEAKRKRQRKLEEKRLKEAEKLAKLEAEKKVIEDRIKILKKFATSDSKKLLDLPKE